MENQNFTNSNEVFPIIDLIRREVRKERIHAGQTDDLLEKKAEEEPNVITIDVAREMLQYPALVTSVLYTYDNGLLERLTLYRDDLLQVTGFFIEFEASTTLNAEMEEEADIPSLNAIRGSIIRENGLFKNLTLDYVRAV
ncbi:hypothetical protein ASL14_04685 [Paenibacillus sp. IHB B 3084]|uniref:hypothetical protein n=1 Tax=unclassified Paenibacillus TaxID=185978 RepID=UPI00071EF2F6|nr:MULTISPECIES: hypothetical protein [unclassified Paenibacillus]ALP35571.1 hypothetical protein ASL14_04685 [Paenibacillus sp. IHB B 3084]MBE0336991.1 hypothetical protein [Paenibacillus sp. 23TSA30-6]